MGGSSMNQCVFWAVTFVAGALGAGIGTKLAQRGPLSRVKRLERGQAQIAETMLALGESVVSLYMSPEDMSDDTKERVRVRIQDGGKNDNAG